MSKELVALLILVGILLVGLIGSSLVNRRHRQEFPYRWGCNDCISWGGSVAADRRDMAAAGHRIHNPGHWVDTWEQGL